MAEKRFIFVCCGAGKLTSFMAAEGVREGLKKRGIKDVTVQHGMINDIPKYSNKITALVSSMNYVSKHEFPVFIGLPFITGDEEGQEKVVDELAEYLRTL